MKMGRRNMFDAPAEESAPAWLTTYSDMMTDLLAIFVILFAFAMTSKPVTRSTSAPEQAASNAAEEQSEQQILSNQDKFNSFVESINSHIADSGLSEKLSVVKQKNGVVLLRVADSALFDSGRADIDSKAAQLLGSISTTLEEHSDFIKMIRIEGHTDNRPINNEQFDSNWELSTSRAVNVLRRLLDISKIKPEKFSAVGYGEFHPIADNNTASGRAQNRRVDFIIETAANE